MKSGMKEGWVVIFSSELRGQDGGTMKCMKYARNRTFMMRLLLRALVNAS